ncbi:MAG: CoB--CoM heterodisulfide reductase iron-sulfur subunit B family protein [Thermoleophilia bacterium]
MTVYTYFPGCSLTSTAIEYDTSFRRVSAAFDIGLEELEDWNCCGASPAPHHLGGNLGVFLPARNLHIAGEGHAGMVAPCAGCYTRHKYAQYELGHNTALRQEVEDVLQEPVRYQTEVLNIVQLFNREISPEALARKAQGRLSGVKLATYYGCVLTRPAKIIQFDNPKDPVSMEPLLEACGAGVPFFPFKMDCCGSYMGLAKKEIVLSASRRIIEAALDGGFDALVTACPLCHQNLDLRQGQINSAFGTSYELPVLYYSQAIGLGLGFSPAELGIDAHAVSVGKLMRKMAAVAGGLPAADGRPAVAGRS